MKEIKRVELCKKGVDITLYNNGIVYFEIPGFKFQIMVEQIKHTSFLLKEGKLKSPITLGNEKISIELTDAGTVRIPALGDVFTVAKISDISTKLKEEETLHLEYCPHCGTIASEIGVEHHTSGFTCDRCLKQIPFRSECGLVIEEVKPSTPVKILWFSRHQMSAEQLADLERIYGTVEINQISSTINSAYDIKDAIEKNDVIAIVAPINLQAQFLQIAGERPVISCRNKRVLTPGYGEGIQNMNINPGSFIGGIDVSFVFDGWFQIDKIEVITHDL